MLLFGSTTERDHTLFLLANFLKPARRCANIIGKFLSDMEVWYTDKKRGICHGEIKDRKVDYCQRRMFLVNGSWLMEEQLFRSKDELKEALDEYVRKARWDNYERLGLVIIGRCTFKQTGRRQWL